MDDEGQVVDIYRSNHQQWSQIIKDVVDLCRKWNAQLLVEVNGIGDPLAEQISRQWPKTDPFITTNRSKQDIVESLILDMNDNKVSIPSQELFPHLYQEMETYTYEYNPKSRTVRYTHPPSLHDDCVQSLCLANYNRRTNYTKGQYVTMGSRR